MRKLCLILCKDQAKMYNKIDRCKSVQHKVDNTYNPSIAVLLCSICTLHTCTDKRSYNTPPLKMTTLKLACLWWKKFNFFFLFASDKTRKWSILAYDDIRKMYLAIHVKESAKFAKTVKETLIEQVRNLVWRWHYKSQLLELQWH
jgi:hypothetical protein